MLYRQTYVVDGQTFVTVNDQQFNVVISPTEKSVILHPVINGEVDTTIVIYPQTVTDNVIGLDEKILEAVSPKQDKSNLVTELSVESTDTQYPSAKLVYDELQTKQDSLTAGSNIQIDSNTNTISATDTTYSNLPASQGGQDVSLVTSGDKYNWNHKQNALTAGTGINITNDEISVTYENLQAAEGGTDVSLVDTGEKYTWDNKQNALVAGANIQIDSSTNTISATDTTYTAGDSINITNEEISADTLTTSEVDVVFNGGYSVTTTIVNGTIEGDSSILFDSITLTIVPNIGYYFPDTIIVQNAQYIYNNITGTVILSDPTSNIIIQAECRKIPVLTVSGLGNSDPTTVVFTENEVAFDWNFPEVTVDGNIFIKIPTMYRKVNTVTSNQITSFSLANAKIDNDYEPYPCFLDSDGTTVLPYVLIGKYCCSSTSVANSVNSFYAVQTLENGRTNARALGTGYQLYDWQIQKLFVDLAMMKAKTVNFNDGSAVISEYLGIAHLDQTIWIDGIYHNDTVWYAALNPANYVSNPSTHPPVGYSALSYACPTTNSIEVKALGYDSNNPFVNYPSAVVSNSSYNTYYCDAYYYSSGSHPVRSDVGGTYANVEFGLWYCFGRNNWSNTFGVRLCYKPPKSV